MDRHSSYTPPMTSTTPTTETISNFLMGAAQRGAARRNSLEAARLSSLGLAPSRSQLPQQSVEDQIVFEALMAAERAVQSPPPSLNQHTSTAQPVVPPPPQHSKNNDPDKLQVPSPKAKLPSMEHMQLRDIVEPHDHDVLCGRGGSVNNHAGNEKFRRLVQSFKVKYLLSTKADKYQLSDDVVRAVRSQDPPGRFLQRDENNGKWFDIGDRAREKAAQALREGAPDIRESLKQEKVGPSKQRSLGGPLPMTLGQPNAGGAAFRRMAPGRGLAANTVGNGATTASLLSGRYALLDNMATRSRRGSRLSDADLMAGTMSGGMDHTTHNLHSNNVGRLHKEGVPPEQLAADIMTAHVEQQAREAQVIAEAQAVARAASLPMGPTTNQMPLLDRDFSERALPGIPLDRRHSIDSVLGGGNNNGTVLLSGYATGRDSLNAASSSLLGSSRLNSVPRLDPDKVLLAKAMIQQSLAERGQGRQFPNTRAKSTSISNDHIQRLVFAETIAQRTAQGTATDEMKAEEKRMGLYLDAGLLGMDLGEIRRKRAMGQTEQAIVDECYDRLKLKRDKENDENVRGKPVRKRRKLGNEDANGDGKDIEDALDAIGAMIRLRSHGAESESDDSAKGK